MKYHIFILIICLRLVDNNSFAVSNDNYLFINDVALEPSGKRYWVGTNDAIYQLDAETHEIRQTIEMPGPVKLLDVSPDGQKIMAGGELVGGASPGFYEIRSIKGGLIKSVTGCFKLTRPVFSQDSSLFIVILSNENKVQVYDCDAGELIMETDPVDQTIYSAAVHPYGSENQYKQLYVFAESNENGLRYLWLHSWGITRINKISELRITFFNTNASHYSNQLLSINGTYYADIFQGSIPTMDYTLWSIYTIPCFVSKFGELFGNSSPVVCNFTDDENFFWAVANGMMIQELEGEQRKHEYFTRDGIYQYIADFCMIDQKPIIIVLFRRYSDDQYVFALVDVESKLHISESPPITEMFQDSNIQSWMTHE